MDRALPGEPRREAIVAQTQVDEARPGNLRRMAEVRDIKPFDDGLGHVVRRPAQPLAQRHGEVRLVVAKLRILARTNEVQQRCDVLGQSTQGVGKSLFEFYQDAHR